MSKKILLILFGFIFINIEPMLGPSAYKSEPAKYKRLPTQEEEKKEQHKSAIEVTPQPEVAINIAPEPINPKQLSYDDVLAQNIQSLGRLDSGLLKSTGGDVIKFIERTRKILLEITELVKKNVSFKILNDIEKEDGVPVSVIDKTTWRDLDLLSGSINNPGTYLGSIINRTSTELGKAYLLGNIARPKDNIPELQQVQDNVKEFVNNPQLLAEVDAILQEIKKEHGEGHLLSYWDNGVSSWLNPQSIQRQYFRVSDTDEESTGKVQRKFNELKRALNTNNIALTTKSFWDKLSIILNLGLESATPVILTLTALHNLTQPYTGLEPSDFLNDYAKTFIGTSGPFFAILSYINKMLIDSGTLGAGVSLAGGITTGLGLSDTFAWAKAAFKVDTIIQKKLVPVARFFEQAKDLNDILTSSNLFNKLKHAKDLQSIFNSQDRDIQQLLKVLRTNTFAAEGKLFNMANVLVVHKLLQKEDVEKKLQRPLAAIAEIDMYVSIAKLYNEFKDKDSKFCFPNYMTKHATPVIELQNYWNPFVKLEDIVVNSTILGTKNSPRNAIITGPNSAGKSTVLKSIALAIILAQSIGIAPAELMEFTPFSHVSTYMDITDDISNKTSLFQSEVDRAVKLQALIQSLPESGPHRESRVRQLMQEVPQQIIGEFPEEPGKFSFTMFDELFSGTSPDEGMAIAFAVAEEIGKLPNSICMIATHYKLLTDLEAENEGFANYKVGVIQPPGGIPIKRLYKLERGISEQHIALDVARERGVKGPIIDRASQILEKIHDQKREWQEYLQTK